MNYQLVVCILCVVLFCGCSSGISTSTQSYMAFDTDLPGTVPKVFAKTHLAPAQEFVGYGRFDPLTGDFYYSITNEKWFPNRLHRISPGNRPELLQLVSDSWEGEPVFTPDHHLVITAINNSGDSAHWQADLYRLQRDGGNWVNPTRMPDVINSPASEWNASFANNGNFYFSSERKKGTSALHGDLYVAKPRADGQWLIEELPLGINTDYNDSDPLIAPDESFLIFHSNRPGGVGEHDLYVSFKTKNGWSEPQNLGSEINTSGWEMAPALTLDGKFLLFTWRAAMETKIPSEIRWVSIDVLKPFKNKASGCGIKNR
ncbi:WD40 domain protein beta Propeller [Cellvibrio sp. BR]|uniref:TolB family protein n=1 Tax=Cellvibrio sp. BR TaxID=1134474 RepID=UPI0002600B26|nr:PD40 domain-containing protein [Cellvibrio sp. BR]EIK42948.1 WD40 domain protein beta Propeller [Cellvibrio sp. BR]